MISLGLGKDDHVKMIRCITVYELFATKEIGVLRRRDACSLLDF